MKPEQRAVYAQTVAGRRGSAPANVMVWLQSPNLAARAQKLGECVRYETVLPARLSELAILIVARHWSAHYEWAVHEVEAARAGVTPAVIAAIRDNTTPSFDKPADEAVYAFSRALVADGRVPTPTFDALVLALGSRAAVELTALVGYYTMVAMTLNTFEIPAPKGLKGLE
ncbi:MAG: carboxymuconolactone decarboxylase family protein [Acidobacteria bacterium]|nr:carboxymuconolactone decarboxylase family protein [Acidobacteriota bacterium]